MTKFPKLFSFVQPYSCDPLYSKGEKLPVELTNCPLQRRGILLNQHLPNLANKNQHLPNLACVLKIQANKQRHE